MASLLTQARRALLGLTDTEKSLQEHFGSPDRDEVLAQHAQATQAAHTQVAAQPPGPLSTGARALKPPTTTATDLHCWAKFMPAGLINGEYGFDWVEWQRAMPFSFGPEWLLGKNPRASAEITKVMDVPIANLEYCYDAHQQQYLPVSKDIHLKTKLYDEYPRLTVYEEDYFVGWLSMKLGQKIQMMLHIEALNTASLNGDYLTFGVHASYRVTTSLDDNVNEAIRIPLKANSTAANPQMVLLTIECVHACTDTALLVLDEKKVVVGQLNVVDNTKIYHLPVRVVYLVKESPAAATQVKQLQQKFLSLDLKNYLNEHILNQALIQAHFEKTNRVHQVHFKESEWANDRYYDVEKGCLKDVFEMVNGEFAVRSVLDKAQAEYSKIYEKPGHVPFRGVILIITNIPKEHDGNSYVYGEGNFAPVNFRSVLVYSSGADKVLTYKHEIGHILGLEHIFYDGKLFDLEFASVMKLKAQKVKKLAYNRALIKKEEKQVTNLINSSSQDMAQIRALSIDIGNRKDEIIKLEYEISTLNGILEGSAKSVAKMRKGTIVSSANKYKFAKFSTKNIMDYSDPTESFFHWQWKIMRNDVLKYYGSEKNY